MKDCPENIDTAGKRIAWFCEHFDVSPPALEHDDDEPDAILLTDELMRWIRVQGASMDWVFCGGVAGMASVFREKHKIDPETAHFLDLLRELDPQEREVIVDALRKIGSGEVEFSNAMENAQKRIDALRTMQVTTENGASA